MRTVRGDLPVGHCDYYDVGWLYSTRFNGVCTRDSCTMPSHEDECRLGTAGLKSPLGPN
jgi:hypothetical protein